MTSQDWREDWIKKYTEYQRRSPYHEISRRAFDIARVRTAENVRNWDLETRKERARETREYRARTKWIREHTPVTSDTYYAKYDSGIRIVPVDERISAPYDYNPFYNPGSAPWIP
jgi:hypothetical protein